MMKLRRKFFNSLLIFILFLFGALLSAKAASAASLSLDPANGNVKAGEDLVVNVVLNATNEGLIDGADAALSFDADKLKIKEIKAGSAFANIVTKEKTGHLQITGLASTKGTSFSSAETIATVTFEVLDSGLTNISLDYTSGSTTDSNVVSHKTSSELLGNVSGGSYSIQATGANQFFSFLRKMLPAFLIVLVFLVLAGFIIWFLRSRKGGGEPEGNVFYPEEVPLDKVPDQNSSSPSPALADSTPYNTAINTSEAVVLPKEIENTPQSEEPPSKAETAQAMEENKVEDEPDKPVPFKDVPLEPPQMPMAEGS